MITMKEREEKCNKKKGSVLTNLCVHNEIAALYEPKVIRSNALVG